MWCTVDIVETLKPKFVIWENVKNLLGKKHVHNFNAYLEIMDKLGYNSYFEVLNAKDFGVPQNRERVYTISIRKDIDSYGFKFPEKQELKIRLKDVLEDTVADKYYLSDKMIEGFQQHNKNHIEKGTGFIWKTRDTDGIASALRANGALCPTDNTINVGEVTPNSQAGQVYSDEGISPTLIAGTHGYAMGNIMQSQNKVDEKYFLTEEQVKKIENSNFVQERKRIQNTDICDTLLARDYKDPKCVRVGGMFDTENSKHQAGSIYDKEGIAPPLDTMQGGYRQPMVTIDNPLKGKSKYGWHFEQNVYSEDSQCCRSVKAGGGSGNIPKVITSNIKIEEPKIITVGNYSPSNHDASRIVDEKGIAPTVKENHGTVTAVVQSINQDVDNTNKIIYEEPLERKGWHRKACEVLNPDGISTCIHTQSNNLLQKIKVEERFFRQALEVCQENELQNGDTIDAFNKRVNSTGISPTITTRPEGFKTAILPIQNYRIRKLTPKECWRLMRIY